MAARYVIIGNSAAGLAGAETIRRLDERGEITIISDEPYPAYCRPLLTYLLAGEIRRRDLWLKAADYYDRWRFRPVLGRRVVAVRPETKQVQLEDGTEIPYDRLLVASGARPMLPGIPGQDLEGVFTIRTWGEFQGLLRKLRPDKPVAVIGSGLVGITTAQALARRGQPVTLLSRDPQVLSTLLDATAAGLLHQVLTELGVQLRFHVIPAALTGKQGRVTGVVLTDGQEVPADLVVIGIGVQPNVEFLPPGVLGDKGAIAVDRHLATGLPGVFAAGDCVQAPDRLTGRSTYYAIWPAAVEQGQIAGANMAGQLREYAGILPQNSFHLGNIRIIAGGQVKPGSPDGEVHTFFDPLTRSYRRLVIDDGCLVGITLVNRVEEAGVYFSLMSRKIPLRTLPWDPRRPDFQAGRLLA